MKYLLALCLTLNLFAEPIPLVNIEGFSGKYEDSSGSGLVEIFNYGEYDFINSEFLVEKQAGTLLLKTEDEEIILDSLPEFIHELKKLSWNHLAFKTTEEKISLSVPSFAGVSLEDDLDIKGLELNCDLTDLEDELSNIAYDSCFNNKGVLKFSKISHKKVDEKRLTITNFWLSNNENKFSINLRYSKKNIKGYGRIYFRNNKLEINIIKLKAGIFNAKNILFKELSKLESEGLEVKKPWIKIDLN